jgi:hypothetical protein
VFTPDYLNPALMLRHFEQDTMNDIEKTKQYIIDLRDVKRTKKISALDALENIKKYITNHRTQESHWDAFKVYIRKSDSIWKQDFNQHIQNYKFIDGEIVRNV